MTPSHDLFDLIQSMSATERRSFIASASRSAGGKRSNYLRLYNAIAQMSTYDERELRKRFAREAFVRQLSSAKNYLYGLIIDHLRSLRESTDSAAQVETMLARVALLVDRRLFGQASRLLQRARGRAEVDENLVQLVRIGRLEATIAALEGRSRATIERHVATTLELGGQLHEYLALALLHARAMTLHTTTWMAQTEEQIAEARSILDDPIVQTPSSTLHGELRRCEVQKICYLLLRQTREEVRVAMRLVDIYRTHKDFARSDAGNVISAYANLVSSLLRDRRHDEAREVLREMMTIDAPTTHLRARLFFARATRELLLIRAEEDDGRTSARLRELWGEMQRHRLSSSERYTVRRAIYYGLFGQELYLEATRAANACLAEPKELISPEQRDWFRIGLVICHYELGHVDLVESLIRSISRDHAKRTDVHWLAAIIARHLRVLLAASDRKGLARALRPLRDEIRATGAERRRMDDLRASNTYAWIESRVTNRSLADVIRELRRANEE